jgi:hypothetical protein
MPQEPGALKAGNWVKKPLPYGWLLGGVRRHSTCLVPPPRTGVPRLGAGELAKRPTYCRLPHANPRLRHRFRRFRFNHLDCRGPHWPGLLGLQGQLIGHLKCLPQRQDDLVGEVLGESRALLEHRSLEAASSLGSTSAVLTVDRQQGNICFESTFVPMRWYIREQFELPR